MSAWSVESENINYDLISLSITDFIKRVECNEWFEGLFVSGVRNNGLFTELVVNLVYDGTKGDSKIYNLTGSLFELLLLESSVFITLNKIDINNYSDSENSSLNYLDVDSLKSGKIITDKNSKLTTLKMQLNSNEDEYNDGLQDDILPGIQYVK